MTIISSKPLGKNGPLVPAMGFGCMGLSAYYTQNPGTDEERFAVFDRAFELGETFWVTSDVYGDSEDLLRKWFHRTGKREEVFVATKFGYTEPNAMGYPTLRSDPEFVKQACVRSLLRLGVDRIDLYLPHRIDEKTPIEKTVQAMVELKNEGKIGWLGLSEVSAATLRRACAVHHIAAVEVEYSPFAMDIESEQNKLLETCKELGVAVIAYSPLGRGILTGRYNYPADLDEGDGRRFFPRFSGESFERNMALVKELGVLARRKGCSASQLTLAWLMRQELVFPIPGTTRVKNLEENLGAFWVGLTDREVDEIRKVIEASKIYGGRYPEGFTDELFRDTPPLI